MIYVDDILIMSKLNKIREKAKTVLNIRFEMRDLGLVRCFLDVEISNKADNIHMTQTS